MTVMYTIHAPVAPTLAQAAQILGLDETDLDVTFGVAVIDFSGSYAVLVNDDAVHRVQLSRDVGGPFSDPSVGLLWLPERPSRGSVLGRAAEMALDAVIDWLDHEYEEHRRPVLLKQISEALDYSFDGYDRCVYLQRNYNWSPNADLVEILDEGFVIEAHHERVREWVAENGIEPQFAVGDEIGFIVGKLHREFLTGRIDAIHPQTAHYLVEPTGGGLVMVPFEDARLIRPGDVQRPAATPEAIASAESVDTHHDMADATDT